MSDMDEISFWIYTKRAPCLFNFDSLTDGYRPESVQSVPDNVPTKKKKRKLSILDDESVLSEKQQNLYFDVQTKNQPVNGCESSTAGSDIDFNIKKSSIQDKRKRIKLQRSSRTTLHKKNKLVTSTPKPQVLRRSMRKVQNSLNNNSQLNTSYEIFNSSVYYNNESFVEKKQEVRNKIVEKQVGDQTVPSKPSLQIASQPILANDKYEDLSDVSGFTANYIRSTKIHSKTPRKIKAKRTLMKESHQSIPKDDSRMVICVNKSMNTGMPQAPLNCSTDSSQNVINLVTIKNNNKAERADKSTSLLKFMDTTTNGDVQGALDSSKETFNLDSSFPKSSSRYPKRNKSTAKLVTINEKPMDRRKKISNGHSEFNSKENPNDKLSRTRSGRSLGLSIRHTDNSVLVVSNVDVQISSTASMNVASPALAPPSDGKRKKRYSRVAQMRNSDNYCSRRESLRDKSGFAQCFSDSDDNEPQKQKKYFC